MKKRYWISRADRLLGGEWLTDEQADGLRERGLTLALVSGDGR